jgi:uncharacterized protein involved in type VI secretion and phage assembly
MYRTITLGIVVGLDDPEGLGRVQVRCPAIDSETRWARVVKPLAAGLSDMILPKPGSEVLIAFASGDFAHPYVIGGLWDPHDTPPIVQGPFLL